MKLHDMWRYRYRQARDLDHLNAEELSERLHDCTNNIRIRSSKGKLSVRVPTDRVAESWWVPFTEILEECLLRGYPYPGPIDVSKVLSRR
jgi:hypothetical protein